MSNLNKSPPLLSKSKTYDDWIKLLSIWLKFTSLESEKQGPAIVLTLEGEAQDAVLELHTDMISGTGGVSKIIERLTKIYKKDELSQKYNALEAFETYKRKGNTSIRDFLTEFEKSLHKTRTYGTIMSDDLLAYHLLKAANLTTRQLVKATITKLNYEIVKSKLTKVFSDESELMPPDVKSEVQIKSEPTFHTLSDETPYTQTYPDHYNKEDQYDEENYETFYTRDRDQSRRFRSRYPPTNQTGFNRYSASQSNSSNTNWKSPNTEQADCSKTAKKSS